MRIATLADSSRIGRLDPSVAPWPGSIRRVAGHEIFLRTAPSSASVPALYVHGLGGASTNFTDLAGLLAPELNGEAIDLPGFGRSGPSITGDYSIKAHADVVIAYLQGRGPVHLVGNSMGGTVAIRVAATRPELVRTLTLISPAVPDLRPKRVSDLALPLLMVPGVGARLLRRADRGDAERAARAVLDVCFAHPERIPDHRVAEAVADLVARRELGWGHDAFLLSMRGIAASYLTVGSGSAWRLLSRICVPTLVIWGDRDALVDVCRAPRVAATVPGASLLVLPDVGHVAQLEEPDVTARAIVALCDRSGESSRATAIR